MKSIGKSNKVSKSALSIAYFAAALVLTPVAAAAESNGNTVLHRFTYDNRRPALSASHQLANPPFSYACTTDGGHRLGCDSGWVYR